MAEKELDLSKLFIYVEKLRLDEDRRIITEKINKYKEEDKIGDSWNKFKISMNNFRKKVVTSAANYEKKKSTIDKSFEDFAKKTNNKVISDEEAKEIILKLNEKDENKLASFMFNINVALDNTYEYVYEDEGLKVASRFINNGDINMINNIKNELEEYYKVIADKNLSNLQKGILTGIVLSSLAAAILVPITATTAASLAVVGLGEVQLGAGVLALASALLGTALVGGSYLALKQYNEQEVKNEFRKLNSDEVALQLSIQALLIRKLSQDLQPEEFKNRLDSMLKEINILKSDLDYYLFVERNEVEKNKNKIKVFHGFDLVLEDILKI